MQKIVRDQSIFWRLEEPSQAGSHNHILYESSQMPGAHDNVPCNSASENKGSCNESPKVCTGKPRNWCWRLGNLHQEPGDDAQVRVNTSYAEENSSQSSAASPLPKVEGRQEWRCYLEFLETSRILEWRPSKEISMKCCSSVLLLVLFWQQSSGGFSTLSTTLNLFSWSLTNLPH